MKAFKQGFLLISLAVIVTSCHTLNRSQATLVKSFAGNAKDVSDLPYRILVNYCEIRFKIKQLLPENYQPEERTEEGYNRLPDYVLSHLDQIKNQYMESLEIIKRMRGSEKELAGMIQRLDRITGYMQLATTLMQTLLPLPSTASPAKSPKENK